jgi:hypothetical protein
VILIIFLKIRDWISCECLDDTPSMSLSISCKPANCVFIFRNIFFNCIDFLLCFYFFSLIVIRKNLLDTISIVIPRSCCCLKNNKLIRLKLCNQFQWVLYE